MKLTLKKLNLLQKANSLVEKMRQSQVDESKGWKLVLHSLLFFATLAYGLLPILVRAESNVVAADGTGTFTELNSNIMDITGGNLSEEVANLFLSLPHEANSSPTVNFLSTPDTESFVEQIGSSDTVYPHNLQLKGGNTSLSLIQPSSIVPASLVANTGNAIDAGNFTGRRGQNLSLVSSTDLGASYLSPLGEIIATIVPGENWVRLQQPGNVLCLDIKPVANLGMRGKDSASLQNWTLSSTSLPTMLTGASGGHATAMKVNSDGSVQLTGSGIGAADGNAVAKKLPSPEENLAHRAGSNGTLKTSPNTGGSTSPTDGGSAIALANGTINPSNTLSSASLASHETADSLKAGSEKIATSNIDSRTQPEAAGLNATESKNLTLSEDISANAKIGEQAATNLDRTIPHPEPETISAQSNMTAKNVNLSFNNPFQLPVNIGGTSGEKLQVAPVQEIISQSNALTLAATTGDINIQKATGLKILLLNADRNVNLGSLSNSNLENGASMLLNPQNNIKVDILNVPEQKELAASLYTAGGNQSAIGTSRTIPLRLATELSHSILPSHSFADSLDRDNLSLLSSFSSPASTATSFDLYELSLSSHP